MDLENAKAYLSANGCTCVLCRGEEFYSSQARGVKPLLDFLDSGKDFSGFSAADKVVGRATAFLYCLLGVAAIHAGVLSDGAAQVLTEAGIPFTRDTQVPGIRNRTDTGPCPMEQATAGITQPEAALAAIRSTLEQLAKGI